MRLVIDTNVVVSAQVWGGTPRRLLEYAAAGSVHLFTCQELLAELDRVLRYPKITQALTARGFSTDDLVLGYAELASAIPVSRPPGALTRDPDDDIVLAVAHTARADLIVSGDVHLLELKQFEGIAIVNAAAAVARCAGP